MKRKWNINKKKKKITKKARNNKTKTSIKEKGNKPKKKYVHQKLNYRD